MTAGDYETVDDWLDAFFDSYYRRRPVNATFVGRHAYDDRLPDYSPAAVEAAVEEIDDLLAAHERFDPETMSTARAIDHRLAGGALAIQRWELTGDHFHRSNPCLYTGEAIFGVLSLFLTDYAPLADRVDAAVARMRGIPELLEQAERNVDDAPEWWIERATDECRGALAFFDGDVTTLAETEGIEHPEFGAAAERAEEGFRSFRGFLEGLTGTDDYACGTDPLKLIVSEGHCRPESLDEIVAAGREELRQAESYLESHAADFGAETVAGALETQAQQHPTVDTYYERHAEALTECRRAAEAAGLVNWPEYPLEFVPRPEWVRAVAQETYFLYYRAPAPEDDVEPVEYLLEPVEPEMDEATVKRRLRRWNESVIKANHVAHHGGIGHHVQNYHAARSESRIGRMAAVDTASRIALVCGGTMAEGWAPYATRLMAETDYYTDRQRYALENHRRRNAARAVVDVQLHRGEMTAEEAAEFYQRRAGMSPGIDLSGAGYEVVKNSMFPGTALMYLLGPATIRDLRAELEAELGDAFELSAFHDELLSFGSVPATIAAERVRARRLEEGSA